LFSFVSRARDGALFFLLLSVVVAEQASAGRAKRVWRKPKMFKMAIRAARDTIPFFMPPPRRRHAAVTHCYTPRLPLPPRRHAITIIIARRTMTNHTETYAYAYVAAPPAHLPRRCCCHTMPSDTMMPQRHDMMLPCHADALLRTRAALANRPRSARAVNGDAAC